MRDRSEQDFLPQAESRLAELRPAPRPPPPPPVSVPRRAPAPRRRLPSAAPPRQRIGRRAPPCAGTARRPDDPLRQPSPCPRTDPRGFPPPLWAEIGAGRNP